MPNRTETVWLVAFATARSGFPSPLRSPIAIAPGPVPTAKFVAVEKLRVGPLNVPFVGPPGTTVNFNASRSTSLPVRMMGVGVLKGTFTLCGVAVGGLFTDVTVTTTRDAADVLTPSLTVKVKLS